ncbi:MAG TPA: zinc ribbon domain-containing protein [Gaiellaceae bacterium]|nr:zinc ribbon domain-containing protein [Gaiellaceae bacterium]
MHSALHIAANLTVFLAVVFCLGLAYWMYRDASRRLTDPWLVGSAGLLGVAVPYLGALIYLLVRPPETLAEAHARDLEVQALSQRLNRRDEHCPVCHAETEPKYLVCPVCTTQLRQACRGCEAALDPLWQVCPYCTTPTAAPTLEPVADDLDAALARETARHVDVARPALERPPSRRSLRSPRAAQEAADARARPL